MDDWTAITTAIGTALGGDQQAGKEALMSCWNATGPTDHAQRCVLAHYLADTETDLELEISWDEAALQEHRHLDEDDLAPLGIPSTRGMLPSLHLNLGDGYHRNGKITAAREHLALGMASSSALANDGYGKMIAAGLENLARRIDAGGSR
ncbi:hypothetical protein H9639_12805 [Arthrobacter sp. Sa2CUA1]|uniref:Tetratricopeptide repeat protein n=2 Tax=Arthrobacter gallicola TaxID=2762225 RepID=A0ABR8UUH2_9MICC|nr:hypothetical protein [Arthrobacter gallicola]